MKIEGGHDWCDYDGTSRVNHLILKIDRKDVIELGYVRGPRIEVDVTNGFYSIEVGDVMVRIYPVEKKVKVKKSGWRDWYPVDDTIFEVK